MTENKIKLNSIPEAINAIKNGEVIIRAYPLKNKKIRVEIVDTGVGIVYSYQQFIFQRFYRSTRFSQFCAARN